MSSIVLLKEGMVDTVTLSGVLLTGVLYVALSAYFYPEGLMRLIGLLVPVLGRSRSSRLLRFQGRVWKVMDGLDTRAKLRAAVHADREDEQFAAVSKLSQVRDARVSSIMRQVIVDPNATAIIRNVAQAWIRRSGSGDAKQ